MTPPLRERVLCAILITHAVLSVGCGSKSSSPHDDGVGGQGGNDVGVGGGGGDGGDWIQGGAGGDGGDGGDQTPPVSPCGEVFCTEDQHCEEADDAAECTPNTCEELGCSGTQECVESSLGAHCEDSSCDEDVDCVAGRYCDADEGICKEDVCAPGARSCSATGTAQTGDAVYICHSNGGGFVKETDCSSAGSFASQCVDLGSGEAGCGCEDDWDCPGYQECEAGLCQGSLTAPTCRLEPADLAEVLPTQELVWGSAPGGSVDARLRLVDAIDVPLAGQETGEPGEPAPAALSPWSNSPQATQVPIVANIDDDNGDGVVDEKDVPEILFLSFRNGDVNDSGVMRVIHGGGTDAAGNSKKGRDYLAVCGNSRWFAGKYYDANGDELGSEPTCNDAADLDPASTLAVGDLNYDGFPEIVVFNETDDPDDANDFDTSTGAFSIFDNEGRRLLRSPTYQFQQVNGSAENPGVSLANVVQASLPENEFAEIVIGRDLFTLGRDQNGDWAVTQRYEGGSACGVNDQGPVSCVADLIPGRPGMEIVAGSAVYGIPLLDGALDTSASTLVELGSDAGNEGFCAIADVWGTNTATAPGPANPLDQEPEIVLVRNGELYVYDVIVTQPATPGDEWNVALTELTGGGIPVPGTDGGGAPNIDDFDGDGFPEIGTAGPAGYIVFDLQVEVAGTCPAWLSFDDNQASKPRSPPGGDCDSDADCNVSTDASTWAFACNENANVGNGTCVCLHNSWRRLTQDGSSKVTGSSVFDFNGDGSAEVIYNDECHFRMYAGLDGTEAFLEESESRTRIEYPVVADVDNDGNAEIVFATTTESGFCNRQDYSLACDDDLDCPSGDLPGGQRCVDSYCQVLDPAQTFNAGIEVWGDLSDRWVSARRVWNQYSYHVTNVNESGGIPRIEPNSWEPLGARLYNTYRSQPRSFGSAPDLVVEALQVIAPGSCGSSTNVVIGVQVKNQGDLRVSNVPVSFMGTWDDEGLTEQLTDGGGQPLIHTINQTLEPGAFVVFQIEYDKDNNPRASFPDGVTVIVDPTSVSQQDGVARECEEDNNTATEAVNAAPPLPDLRLVLEDPGSSCPPAILGTVYNQSNVDAADVVVRIYSGDPSNGAFPIGNISIGSVGAGESVAFDSTDDAFGFDGTVPTQGPILLFGDVDPDDDIAECNESNNRYGPTGATSCIQIR